MDQFADIRPYNDDEVPTVISQLLADDEMIAAITSLKLGSWHKAFTWLLYPLIRVVLYSQLKKVKTVVDFQKIVKRYMDDMVDQTTDGFTVSGLDNLASGTPHLFMSNHRDIALDPAFVNYALYHNNDDTVRIAIGDNLLTKRYVSNLMRINKSFIVNRSTKGPRQILAAYKKLSSYIHHSLTSENASIWIAQRQGRAKDGVDRTEAAMIKMIAISQDKHKQSFSEYIGHLNIVPVAISYELDPCDQAKAKELYEKAASGRYAKAENEDVQSIATGITGKKANVHVAFGLPLTGHFENAEAVANAIDQQIINNYQLHPSNFIAYKMLHGEYPLDIPYKDNKVFDGVGFSDQERLFKNRVEAIPAAHREYMLGIYANAIESKRLFRLK